MTNTVAALVVASCVLAALGVLALAVIGYLSLDPAIRWMILGALALWFGCAVVWFALLAVEAREEQGRVTGYRAGRY